MHSAVQNNIQLTVRLQTVTANMYDQHQNAMLIGPLLVPTCSTWLHGTFTVETMTSIDDGGSNWLIMTAAVRFCPSGFTPRTVANFGLFGTSNSVGTAVHFRKVLRF